MNCAIIVFPGSNCETDVFKALKQFNNINCEYIWYTKKDLNNFDLIILPGGFSFGDYLRSGSLAAKTPIISALKKAVKNGKKVLGICNGFQILTESGILPGTLRKNNKLNFVCDTVPLEIQNNETFFTSKFNVGDIINLPIAHGEGNYFCNKETLNSLIKSKRIIFRYLENQNPNGSTFNIAGIINSKGNVLGMMPHPERAMTNWMISSDGVKLFKSILNISI